VAEALGRVPLALKEALVAAGAGSPGVLRSLCDGTPEDAGRVVDELLPGLMPPERALAVDRLLWLQGVATPEAASNRRRFEYLDAGVIIQETLENSAAKKMRAMQAVVAEEVRVADAVWRPAVRASRFRLRTDARVAAATGPTARAEAEEIERARWKVELVALIKEAGGPVVEATSRAACQDAALAAAAGGRRARTLAKRVGAWRRVRVWCLDLYATPFPKSVLHMIEYLQARADEPCGLSVLEGVAAGFTFMEDSCGYPRGRRLVDEPLFGSYLKELAAGFAGPRASGPRQAPRYPVGLVLALEREVVDDGVASCYRCQAWWHLLSLWGALRFDDHRGLSPSAVQVTPRGLEATLSRTKTTGPGKRVTALPLVVGREAYLAHADWLTVGWELWQCVAPYVRDYFLVRPAPNLDATVPVEITYEQAARLSRAVLAGLPRETDAMTVMGEAVVGLFTLHSARCWLPSLGALAGIPEADLSYLGRWSPTTTKGYVRTATEVILRVQAEVALRLRRDLAGPVGDVTGEQAAYLEMRRELLRRGFSPQLIDGQFDEMEAWTSQLAAAVPGERTSPDLPAVRADGLGAEDAASEAEAGEEAGEESAADAAPPTPPVVPGEVVREPPPLPLADAGAGPPESGYVVSISKSDWRRLHRLGGCSRHPGIHYLQYELLGAGKPRPEDYDDYCRQCWKAGGPEESSGDEESETEQEEEDVPLLAEGLDLPVMSGLDADI